jgi:hypothetical protein
LIGQLPRGHLPANLQVHRLMMMMGATIVHSVHLPPAHKVVVGRGGAFRTKLDWAWRESSKSNVSATERRHHCTLRLQAIGSVIYNSRLLCTALFPCSSTIIAWMFAPERFGGECGRRPRAGASIGAGLTPHKHILIS